MKKTKLTRSLLAACSIVALSAVMYGCVHNGGDDAPATDMSGTPDPVPEPIEPAGPTDLEDTQAEADAAATAAMTASTNAATSASSAAAATMTLATLQTGDDSNSDAMGGREAAYAAHAAAGEAAAEAAKAATASAAAAAATTGTAGEAALRTALDAQDDAEAAEATAATMAKAAVAAAMTELHIDGTVKTVGESSVDADADTSTSPAGDRKTGFIRNVTRALGAVTGKPYIEADGQAYRQAVEARALKIAKTLDTSDDTARLTVFHSTDTTEMARVYGQPGADDVGQLVADDDPTTIIIRTNAAGVRTSGATIEILDGEDPEAAPTLKSLGMHYEAGNPIDGDSPDLTTANGLVHTDIVGAKTKPKEVFSYVVSTTDNDDVTTDTTIRVVETSRTISGGMTDVTYMSVDTLAPAAPDAHGLVDDEVVALPDADEFPEQIAVKASIPVAKAYSHIHFGVWAGLGAAAAKDGSQEYADLGIGFVQNFSGSGTTDRLGIGEVIYNGDWVATVQRQNATAGTGAISLADGDAMLTANFYTEKFTGMLMGLATLEGTLDGNGFSGMTAKGIMHPDLDASGTFAGEFSGGIYGDKGEEAAGVFDFDGGEAGAFVGAFGGTNQ